MATSNVPSCNGRRKEPAWHRRARQQRSDARVAMKLLACTVKLCAHHGSQLPRIVTDLLKQAQHINVQYNAEQEFSPVSVDRTLEQPEHQQFAQSMPKQSFHRDCTPFPSPMCSEQEDEDDQEDEPTFSTATSPVTASHNAPAQLHIVPTQKQVIGIPGSFGPLPSASTPPSTSLQQTIISKVHDQYGNEARFNITRTTRLQKLMDVYCSRINLQSSRALFIINGERVSVDDTAELLDLENEDIINVYVPTGT